MAGGKVFPKLLNALDNEGAVVGNVVGSFGAERFGVGTVVAGSTGVGSDTAGIVVGVGTVVCGVTAGDGVTGRSGVTGVAAVVPLAATVAGGVEGY